MKTPLNAPKRSLNALIIDHQDSFTHNLKWWLAQKFAVYVINADELTNLRLSKPVDLVVLSAGPKSPADYSQTLEWLKKNPNQPTLGVCLGMQMMTIVEGGQVTPYFPVLHGKTSNLIFTNAVFPSFPVARYHSLECHAPENFLTLAFSSGDEIPMWIEHKKNTWMGWQFHPESFLTTDQGFLISYLVGWLNKVSSAQSGISK